jgi:hypothetical protein
MSKKTKFSISLKEVLAWWFFISLFLKVGGVIGGFLGAWATPKFFLLTLLEVFSGVVTPWGIGVLVVAIASSTLLMAGWKAIQYYQQTSKAPLIEQPKEEVRHPSVVSESEVVVQTAPVKEEEAHRSVLSESNVVVQTAPVDVPKVSLQGEDTAQSSVEKPVNSVTTSPFNTSQDSSTPIEDFQLQKRTPESPSLRGLNPQSGEKENINSVQRKIDFSSPVLTTPLSVKNGNQIDAKPNVYSSPIQNKKLDKENSAPSSVKSPGTPIEDWSAALTQSN